ncbi:MAG: response regulator [Planctomycetes bacterium]|nr:response regulator [Planctomycetota bacterium]
MARILIIEDDDQVRSMLRDRLENEGFEIEEAVQGGEGLSLIGKKSFDLVITDIVMPEVEGIEVIETLKTTNPHLKIIAISGGGRIGPEIYLKIAKSLGANKVFAKPVDWEDLLSSVEALIS